MSLSSKEINRDNLAIRVDLANILETKESLSAFSKEELTYIIILLNTLKDNYYELDNDSNDNLKIDTKECVKTNIMIKYISMLDSSANPDEVIDLMIDLCIFIRR